MIVFRSKSFEKSLKKVLSSGKVKLREVERVIKIFADDKKLPAKYRDHALQGDWKGYWECHIQGDLLLIYTIENDQLVSVLVDIWKSLTVVWVIFYVYFPQQKTPHEKERSPSPGSSRPRIYSIS